MDEILPVIVGINHWDDITGPFVRSIRRHEPHLPILVIDNCSRQPYPAGMPGVEVLRTQRRWGYGQALNIGMRHRKARRYVCLNNDCVCQRPFARQVKRLDEGVLWGSAKNWDEPNRKMMVFSAWLVISQKILDAVGYFDPRLDAAFEDFDYQLRAEQAGFRVDVADLPITHLGKSTRFEERRYIARWDLCRLYFGGKHGLKTLPWETLRERVR